MCLRFRAQRKLTLVANGWEIGELCQREHHGRKKHAVFMMRKVIAIDFVQKIKQFINSHWWHNTI